MKTRAAPKPKLPQFEITVKATDGSCVCWNIGAKDIEDAAAKACKRVTLKKAVPRRTSGKAGEPGWFYPQGFNPRWPFAGNAYKVEPVDPA